MYWETLVYKASQFFTYHTAVRLVHRCINNRVIIARCPCHYCGGIVDWRQRSASRNSRCSIHR